jgi:glycosyltransferase involved in cell wall biosynthesis
MDNTTHYDFYITRWAKDPFKQMDYSELKGLKKVSRNISIIGNFFWQSNVIYLVFKPYKKYLLIGEPYCLSTWIVLILGLITHKKIYLWSHGWYGDESSLKIVVKKLFFSMSTKIFLYGEYARNLMIKENIKASKLVCIYNSLDYEKQKNIFQNLRNTSIYNEYFKNNFPVLIYIGRIQKQKKLNLLIESMKLLKDRNVTCNLVLIGKEISHLNIQERINEYQMERNIWKYGESYDEITNGELLYNANICISPGNIGLTAMHSLVYGTPIITHNNFKNQNPEFEAVIPDETGDFFEEDSVVDLADKISKWIKLTETKRESIRKNCISLIDRKYNPYFQIQVLTNNIK